jgi:hypothetical protein
MIGMADTGLTTPTLGVKSFLGTFFKKVPAFLAFLGG